jgi:hypothetical protein
MSLCRSERRAQEKEQSAKNHHSISSRIHEYNQAPFSSIRCHQAIMMTLPSPDRFQVISIESPSSNHHRIIIESSNHHHRITIIESSNHHHRITIIESSNHHPSSSPISYRQRWRKHLDIGKWIHRHEHRACAA